jgi:membrane protease YdiL (CAAX protease family)
MLFLLKRSVSRALAGLLALLALGLALRQGDWPVPPLRASWTGLVQGLAVFAVVVVSDGVIHGTLCLTFGERYRARYRELERVFRNQNLAAVGMGALMAGVGEEMVFRGGCLEPGYLLPMALVFGLLHHIRASLWPITLWSIWEGLLFVIALLFTGELLAVMVAHTLHDGFGFLVFRWDNRSGRVDNQPVTVPGRGVSTRQQRSKSK